MGVVLAAMRRPITVMVLILGIALSALLAIARMPIDIFPPLGMPIIYVAQPYGGLAPAQMEGYVASYYEFHFLYVTGIEQVESRAIQGTVLIKLQFHPGTDMRQALAETVGYVNRARAFMPPGTVPPFVVRFDAGSVPVGDLVFSSRTRSIDQIADLALFKVRPLFAALPGVSAPPPFGGNQRTIVVNVDPMRLRAYGLSPDDVARALSTGNVIVPSGNVRMGNLDRIASIDGVFDDPRDLGRIPLHLGSGGTIFLHDVATIQDASDILSDYALVKGRRSVYIPVTKRADASTWSVVRAVRAALPSMRSAIPPDIHVNYAFDQSSQVVSSIRGLLIEALLGTLLAGLMLLIFLRDPRSALIVTATVPMALLAAVVALWATGQSLNLMTLGGLALSVGLLVDLATVTVENVHRHLAGGVARGRAVLDASREIFVPVMLAMVCVLAVFVPSFGMTGVPRGLFVPLSLSVSFAMIASFAISQTFVPIASAWWLKQDIQESGSPRFKRFREGYAACLRSVFRRRGLIIGSYVLVSLALLAGLGRIVGLELFPVSTAPQIRLRLRAPAGTRVKETELLTLKALRIIKQEAGGAGVATSLAFVGTQPSTYPIDTIYLWTSGPQEAVISLALVHPPANGMEAFREQLRRDFRQDLPGVAISFEPADLVTQVLSMGSPTPLEVAVLGKSLREDRRFARRLRHELSRLPYLRDLQFGQALDYPAVRVAVDRERAGQLGVTMARVGAAFVEAAGSSRFTHPDFWLDRKSGTAYQVQVQVPPSKMSSLDALGSIPVGAQGDPEVQLRDVARISLGTVAGEIDRINSIPVVTLTANLHGQDLGHAAAGIQRILHQIGPPPRGMHVELRGQVALMRDTLGELQGGMILAMLGIFILLAAYYQSFRLALAVVANLPAVLIGVLIALIATGTSLNVESYMGAIMSLGVAVANAILLVTFAEAHRKEGLDAVDAVLAAARERLRPILMTASAMVAGMLPMALGLGDGGSQTAPLGRAVIGGLVMATVTTLTIVPLVFAVLQRNANRRSPSLDPDDPRGALYTSGMPNA